MGSKGKKQRPTTGICDNCGHWRENHVGECLGCYCKEYKSTKRSPLYGKRPKRDNSG